MSSKNNSDDEKTSVSLYYFEEDVFDRTRRFFGDDKLNIIRRSKVLLVGAGAVGNEVAKNLGLLGIGQLNLVDYDMVTKSNLNRCVFFRPQDHMKKYKVEALAERLGEISNTKVKFFIGKIEEAPNTIWDVDLIAVAVDNNYARWFINAKNLSLENPLPMVNGAMGREFVQVDVLFPPYTACLTCSWSEDYYRQIIQGAVYEKCDNFFIDTLPKFPAISFATSLVGAIMSVEIVKILVGLSKFKKDRKWEPNFEPLVGMSIKYDFVKHNISLYKLNKNPDCVEPLCRKNIEY